MKNPLTPVTFLFVAQHLNHRGLPLWTERAVKSWV